MATDYCQVSSSHFSGNLELSHRNFEMTDMTQATAQLIQLGQSNLQVPRICLGTMTWGQQNTEQEAHDQLDFAIANGLFFIDTAEMYPIPVKAETYSKTETMIGNWLRKQNRSQIVLATKIAGPGRGMAWIRTPERLTDGELSKKDIMLACDASLKRLQTDYIDLYQIHWPARYTPLFGARLYETKDERDAISIQIQIEAMQALVQAGKIRAYGLSNETAWGVCEFANIAERLGVTRPATIQNNYSLIARDFEHGLIEACRQEEVSLLSYSPLGFGLLTGKYLNGARPSGTRFDLFGSSWPRYNRPEVSLAVAEYADVAKRYNLTLTELAMGFQMQREFVHSCIIGATSMPQLQETIKAANVDLPPEAMSDIEKIHRRIQSPIQ